MMKFLFKTISLVKFCRWVLRGTSWEVRLRNPTPVGTLNEYARQCHAAAVGAGWWHDVNTGAPLQRNHGALMMLMVSELVEGFEGLRRNLPDDKLPHRRMVEVEFADLLIRVFDYAAAVEILGPALDLDGAVAEKMLFNAQREDHKRANRRKPGGKAF